MDLVQDLLMQIWQIDTHIDILPKMLFLDLGRSNIEIDPFKKKITKTEIYKIFEVVDFFFYKYNAYSIFHIQETKIAFFFIPKYFELKESAIYNIDGIDL